ncbi:MAG TPA: ATP-binding protein [Acidimicrobiales bacterium]|jgi:anti-sigma regulatory factor (Ser/Thr protein kinase)|nr:ATP-binding protein [Acidimicrobiales bacterium]
MNAAAVEAWTFDPEPSSTRAARRLVTDALEAAALDGAVTSAALVVSELATNAVLHARTPFEVRLRVGAGAVRIEVRDGSTRRPTVRNFSDAASSGRGLQVVQQLSEEWGVEADADGSGKTVWALVAVDDPVLPAFDLSAAEW